MAEPRYYAVHLTSIDAEIMATRCGREAGAAYLIADAVDYDNIRENMELAHLDGWPFTDMAHHGW